MSGFPAGQPIAIFTFRFFTFEFWFERSTPVNGSNSSAPMSVSPLIVRGLPRKS